MARLWRQGDILIQEVEAIPEGLVLQKQLILSASNTTGHKHQIKNPRAGRLFARKGNLNGDLFLEITHVWADLVHPEHGTIELPMGNYRVWKQREFTVNGPVRVAD
jgi:hypothetical protein